jgi:small subunit ribosomal protein S6
MKVLFAVSTRRKHSAMAANVYECMFLLDTSKVAGDTAAADKSIRTILERNHAEVLVSRPWDERRLSYPIGTQKKGLYYLTYFSAEGKSLDGIEHDCKLSEMIMRKLVLRIDPKMVETMLALAKGEHATALHNMQEEPDPLGASSPPPGADKGEERRPKREPRE